MNWTYENCKTETLKFTHISDLYKNSKSCYVAIKRNNWSELTNHLIYNQLNNILTYEDCLKEALKYEYKKDFKLGSPKHYNRSITQNWYNDICNHMITKETLPQGYWTYSKCLEEIYKYEYKKDFITNCPTAYKVVRSNGWYDELSKHMKSLGHLYKRLVYVFEFSDNSAYVGLTDNSDRRYSEHLKRGSVSKHILKCPTFIYKELSDYIESGDAQELEHNTKLEYLSNDWKILNTGKTGRNIGSLGGSYLIWTLDKCMEESLKYTKMSDFAENSKSAYGSVIRNEWVDIIYKHAGYNNRYKIWTYEEVKEEALKYQTKNEFCKNNRPAYNKMYKEKWLDVCSHMKMNIKK